MDINGYTFKTRAKATSMNYQLLTNFNFFDIIYNETIL